MTKRRTHKRYNPGRSLHVLLRSRAEKCGLARWLSDTTEYGWFDSFGPYPEKDTYTVMQWAMQRPIIWQAYVVACFIDSPGSYYEEMVTLPPVGPITLSKDASLLNELIVSATKEARSSENPNHYQDTLVVLRPDSANLQELLEDTKWIEQQAAIRADALFYRSLTQEITRLEASLHDQELQDRGVA